MECTRRGGGASRTELVCCSGAGLTGRVFKGSNVVKGQALCETSFLTLPLGNSFFYLNQDRVLPCVPGCP